MSGGLLYVPGPDTQHEIPGIPFNFQAKQFAGEQLILMQAMQTYVTTLRRLATVTNDPAAKEEYQREAREVHEIISAQVNARV